MTSLSCISSSYWRIMFLCWTTFYTSRYSLSQMMKSPSVSLNLWMKGWFMSSAAVALLKGSFWRLSWTKYISEILWVLTICLQSQWFLGRHLGYQLGLGKGGFWLIRKGLWGLWYRHRDAVPWPFLWRWCRYSIDHLSRCTVLLPSVRVKCTKAFPQMCCILQGCNLQEPCWCRNPSI